MCNIKKKWEPFNDCFLFYSSRKSTSVLQALSAAETTAWKVKSNNSAYFSYNFFCLTPLGGTS